MAKSLITTRNSNIRVLKKAKSTTIEDARLMVEQIQKNGNCRNPQTGNPPLSTQRWLAKLSLQSRARIRIITNATADYVFSKSDIWKNFQQTRSILTSTILAYPEIGKEMPHFLEYESKLDDNQIMIRRIDTRQYFGLKNVALAFEQAKIVPEYTGGIYIEKIFPRGEIIVLNDFPQRSDGYRIPDNGSILGTPGEERYILRKVSPWIGNIVRSLSLTTNQHPHDTIFVCNTPDMKFGILIELPPEEPKRLVARQMPLLLPETTCFPKELQQKEKQPEIELPRVLSRELMDELRGRIEKRVQFYSMNPDSLHARTPAILEIGGRLANIARENKPLADNLREYVRESVGWFYLQLGNHESVNQFYYTFAKICDALGVSVPNDIRKIN